MNSTVTEQHISDSQHELSDEQLMLNYRDGEATAFDVLYTRHKGGLFRYLSRHLGQQHHDQVNELFQDVWMKLIKARDRYQNSARFTTYLYHIAHNRLVDYWRSLKNNSVDNVDPDCVEDEVNQPDVQADIQQQFNQLKQLIGNLPEEQRSAFLLKEEAALSLEQIAEITGVGRETVKSRLRYALQRLRESMVVAL